MERDRVWDGEFQQWVLGNLDDEWLREQPDELLLQVVNTISRLTIRIAELREAAYRENVYRNGRTDMLWRVLDDTRRMRVDNLCIVNQVRGDVARRRLAGLEEAECDVDEDWEGWWKA